MPFTFTPKSDEEINADRNAVLNALLMPDGTYKFKVKSVYEKISQSSSKPMLEVLLSFIDPDGSERTIKDYFPNDEKMIHKLKSFCESIGMLSAYESGSIEPHDLWDKSGYCDITVSKGQAKNDGSGFWADKNSVKNYVKPEKVQASAPTADTFNDDITF